MTIEFFAESNVGTRTLPRSLATKAGGFVFVGGQVARDENGKLMTELRAADLSGRLQEGRAVKGGSGRIAESLSPTKP